MQIGQSNSIMLNTGKKHLIAVSYWDSKITTFPVDQEGTLGEAAQVYSDPGKV